MSKRSKIIGFIIGLCFMIPILYGMISIWHSGEVILPEIGENETGSISGEELKERAKDFEVDAEGNFVSTSEDPWFAIETKEAIRTIVVDVENINNAGNAQIFYYHPDTGFQGDQVVSRVIRSGKNYIQIPKGNYTSFRLDLCNRKNQTINISQIIVSKNCQVSTGFYVLQGVAFILCVCFLYLFLFKKTQVISELERQKTRLGEKSYYRAMLSIMIGITALIVYGGIIVSGHEYVYYDIGGGDEPESYIPMFVSYIKQIREGRLSTWTFFNGLGTSTIGVWTLLLNPFVLFVIITGVIFGISTLNTMLLIAQILNVFICGLLCYKYLGYFKGTFFAKAVASYIFAFNGYLVLFSQHYPFSGFCFYILIALILIEEMIECKHLKKVHLGFAVFCGLLFAASIYAGYMIGLFGGIYAIFRVTEKNKKGQIKEAVCNVLRMLGSAILGVMLASPVILTVANEWVVNSERIVTEDVGIFQKILSFLVTPYPLEAIKTIFLRMFSNNLEGIGNNYFGTTGNAINDYYAPPNLFFSIFILLFIIIYYVTLRKREKNRIQCGMRIAAGLMVAFLIFNQLGSATFNAFVAAFGRYTYLLMPIFALVTMTALDEIKKLQGKQVIALWMGSVVVCLVLILQYIASRNAGRPSDTILFVKLEVCLALAAVVLFFFYKKMKKQSMIIVFAVIVMGNVVLESYATVNHRIFCDFSRDLIDEDDDATEDALNYVKQNDLDMYRLEKNYYDLIYYNDAYFQKYHGISMYNSTLNKNVKEFYRMYCNPAINFYGYNGFWYSFLNVSNDIVQNSLLGIRYILSDAAGYPSEKYEKVYANEKISVYKNKEAQSFGIFYDQAVTKSEVEQMGMNDREKILSSAVVLEDEDCKKDADLCVNAKHVLNEMQNSAKDAEKITYQIISNEQNVCEQNKADIQAWAENGVEFTLQFDSPIPDDGRTYFLEFSSDLDYENNILMYFDRGYGENELTPYYHRGIDDGTESEARVMIPAGTKAIRLSCSKGELQIRNLDITAMSGTLIPQKNIPNVKLKKNNYLKGTLQNNEAGYLFLPVPFEKGWKATLDDKETEILKADSGFIAIKLEPGEHKFELKYQYPGVKISCVISGMAIIILFASFINIQNKRRTKAHK